ncbi:MAG TPA: DUF4410 domain-containing protein [Chthoniobacteraceae bacterium]|jgi:hypothetical protein|nr:DUF4410 domain-containing protein [Chthoniobacteraceae bacterium]
MKLALLALSTSLLFVGCAGVRVAETQVASGAVNPRSIYIRPFDVSATEYKGRHRGGWGEQPIRQSLAGRNFANSLKEELEKLAPAMVIEGDERPVEGWLVEGSIDVADNGHGGGRGFFPFGRLGLGQSEVRIHVRIRDMGGDYVATDKNYGPVGKRGSVIYEFDLAGGSRLSGHGGQIYAPGTGDAEPFDFKNAAERVMMALSTDPHRYGIRTSPVIR